VTPSLLDGATSGHILDSATPGLMLDVLPSGKKRWKYRRRLPGTDRIVKMRLGPYPTHSIAAARAWAATINSDVEAGIDPREALRAEQGRAAMTVARAHQLYMEAAHEGRSSRAKRPNKPRTIREKLEVYRRDVKPVLGARSIHDVTEADLVRLVMAKGKVAKIRANRLAAELNVFFGWAASLRGMEVGLESNPAGGCATFGSPRRRARASSAWKRSSGSCARWFRRSGTISAGSC